MVVISNGGRLVTLDKSIADKKYNNNGMEL